MVDADIVQGDAAYYADDPVGWKVLIESPLDTTTRRCSRCRRWFDTHVSDRAFCSRACDQASHAARNRRKPAPLLERERIIVRAYDACNATDAAGVIARQFGIQRHEVIRVVRLSLAQDDDGG